MEETKLEEIVQAMRFLRPESEVTPEQAQILAYVLQVIAQGEALSKDAFLEKIQTHFSLPTELAAMFYDKAKTGLERNENWEIVGFIGLSLRSKHPIQFSLEEKNDLFAWCAFDTFFLPQILKKSAQIESTCSVTKETITATIDSNGVQKIEPEGAVASVIVLDKEMAFEKFESAGDIQRAFCYYSRYFSSQKAAEQWFKEKEVDFFHILTPEDMYTMTGKVYKFIIDHL